MKIVLVFGVILAWREMRYIWSCGGEKNGGGGDVWGEEVMREIGRKGEEYGKVREKVVEKEVVKEVVKWKERDVKELGGKLHFVTFYYPERNQGWDEWRKKFSEVVVRRNDGILRESGFGGLTVFTFGNGVDVVKKWNVSRLVVVDGVEDKCTNRTTGKQNELCPKRVIMVQREFMELGHVVFLDSDAQIVSKKFMEKIQFYKLFADFAATPDQGSWERFRYKTFGTEYNTGMFYINTKTFDNERFVKYMLEDCRLTRHQACLTNYIRNNEDLWVEYLPWTMHCRGKFYGPKCLLIHNWGNAALHGLDWVLNNWNEHLKSL